jgi:hypothetical protein
MAYRSSGANNDELVENLQSKSRREGGKGGREGGRER